MQLRTLLISLISFEVTRLIFLFAGSNKPTPIKNVGQRVGRMVLTISCRKANDGPICFKFL